MKEWLTAREIADEALPDMPASERGVQLLSGRLEWNRSDTARTRSGRDGGGGSEYHFSLLPTLAQVAYTQKHMVVDLTSVPAILPDQPDAAMSARAQHERDGRLAIVAKFKTFSSGLKVGYALRVQVFVDRYNAGMIEVADFVREMVPTLSKRSLARWQSVKRDGKINALGHDPAQARKGTGVLETANGGAVRAFILGQIANQPHLCADDILVQCRAEFGEYLTVISKGVETAVPMPSVRTFQYTLKGLKVRHKVELLKLTNPDAYRSLYAPAGVGMLRHVTEPNQMWQIDASPVDALCVDGRHSIYACIDVATRRMIFHVSRTPRASAVALLIRKAIIAWGVPDLVKTDNGSDFVALDTERLFLSLDIEAIKSIAYTPQEKGHVERGIGTFQRKVGPHLPGFIGHNVTDRKAIENKKSFAKRLGESDAKAFGVTLSAIQLQHYVDEWAEVSYQHRPHAGLRARKDLIRRTPFQAALVSTKPIRTVDERALDLLLMPVASNGGRRTVGKRGVEVSYYHYMPNAVMPGVEVLVRMDTEDLGRAYLFSLDGGQFLGDAICPELSGRDPRQVAAERKAAARAYHERETAPIRKTMKQIERGGPLIDPMLEVARRDAPNVIPLPKRTEAHSTPQIAAAIEAMGKRTNPSRPLTPAEEAERARMIADDEAAMFARTDALLQRRQDEIAELRVAHLPKNENVVALPETAKERYRRAVECRRRLEADMPMNAADAHWLGGYERSPEFTAHQQMHEDFGEDWLTS